jgi:hypothetical protein
MTSSLGVSPEVAGVQPSGKADAGGAPLRTKEPREREILEGLYAATPPSRLAIGVSSQEESGT